MGRDEDKQECKCVSPCSLFLGVLFNCSLTSLFDMNMLKLSLLLCTEF